MKHVILGMGLARGGTMQTGWKACMVCGYFLGIKVKRIFPEVPGIGSNLSVLKVVPGKAELMEWHFRQYDLMAGPDGGTRMLIAANRGLPEHERAHLAVLVTSQGFARTHAGDSRIWPDVNELRGLWERSCGLGPDHERRAGTIT